MCFYLCLQTASLRSCKSVDIVLVQNRCCLSKVTKEINTYFGVIGVMVSSHSSFSFQVSATFAASLVTSPAIGAYLSGAYGDTLVVILATAIALLDICFILVAVPESLPEKMRPASWGAPISWEQADPFAVSNYTILMIILCKTCLRP